MKRRDFLKVFAAATFVVTQATNNDFDYIIVGAGAAGCVLAHRLTASGSSRVLLVEAGRSSDGDTTIATPGRWPSLRGTAWDWAYSADADASLGSRQMPFASGRATVGSTAIG